MLQNPSAERNKGPILEILKQFYPADFSGRAIDFSAGAGVQVVHFAEYFSKISWQPTEFELQDIESIQAYTQFKKLTNVLEPIHLDARDLLKDCSKHKLDPGAFDFIVNINMIHITPWAATQGLFKGAGVFLKPSGCLFTYGPYAVHGKITPDSNVRFDQMLRTRNPEWGLHDVEELEELADLNGLCLDKMFDMPANNKVLVFMKKSL